MSKAHAADNNSVGTVDAQPTDRTIVASAVAAHLDLLDSWQTFRAVSELSEDTIHRLAEDR